MICKKLTDMKKQYFIGDFEPNVVRSEHVEVSLKTASIFTLDAAYYREQDTTVIYIVCGCILVNNTKYGDDDILTFLPGEIINLFALEESKLIVMHFPGTKKDLKRVRWDDFDEMDSFYQKYLDILTKNHTNPYNCVPGERIQPKDITFVVQGYADLSVTGNTVQSIRKYMPDSRIILSTWEECDCTGIDCDELILNKDPGSCECALYADEPIANNGNRQILSTKNGLDKVETTYAFKLRSDLTIHGDDILSYFNAFPKREAQYSIFKNRILIGELYTRNDFVYRAPDNSRHSVPKPFHPSDWFFFGLTEDLRAIYDSIELIPRNEMGGYLCGHPERVEDNKYKYSWRYTTEQHIMLGCVRKKFEQLNFDDWTDWNDETILLSEKIMMNNFVILDFCQHKILNQKYVPACFSNSGVSYAEKELMTNRQMAEYYRNVFGD